MEEMRVYIANLGKYNEGKLVGEWFAIPIDYEEVAKRIGLNSEYEEYAIHDYELPFDIGEYTSIDDINDLCQEVSELPNYILDELRSLMIFFTDVEELCEHWEDIIYYPDCFDMEDVAWKYMEESGMLDSIPEHLQNYFDYEAYGRDLEIEGNFVCTTSGTFEYIG